MGQSTQSHHQPQRAAGRRATATRRSFVTSFLSLCLALAHLTSALPAAAQQPPATGAPVSSPAGPKRTIAVARFVTKSDFDARHGLADVGGGLTDLVTSALVLSNQFIVVERATLGDVLFEQKIAESGLVAAEGAAQSGQLLGASLLVKGAVTEFSAASGGGGFGIGFSGIGVGLNGQKATVGLDLQLIDSTTGQVLSSHPVRETVTSRSIGVDLSKFGLSSGYSKFLQTPVGTAAAKAITTAVQQITASAARQPWTGRVVGIDEGQVVINAGQTSGIRIGDVFGLVRPGPMFTDPATGRVLGSRKVALGRVIVNSVDREIAFASFQPLSAAAPVRGDLVVLQ
jgi:curli biogenesis system outer membrane secretion channel CsgG